MKIEILFGPFYKECDCEAVAGRLFDLNMSDMQFAPTQVFQIDFEINENQSKSLEN